MIIWNGMGFMVVVLGVLGMFLVDLGAATITGVDNNFAEHPGRLFIGFLVAALLVFLFSLFLSNRETRTVIDKESGQEFELGRNDSLFFIPVKWWPILLIILGVVNLLKG